MSIDYLTGARLLGYRPCALREKSSAGIKTPNERAPGRLLAPFLMSVYGGLIQGASARRALSGSLNLFQSATHRLRPVGGGYIHRKEGKSMPQIDDTASPGRDYGCRTDRHNLRISQALAAFDSLSKQLIQTRAVVGMLRDVRHDMGVDGSMLREVMWLLEDLMEQAQKDLKTLDKWRKRR